MILRFSHTQSKNIWIIRKNFLKVLLNKNVVPQIPIFAKFSFSHSLFVFILKAIKDSYHNLSSLMEMKSFLFFEFYRTNRKSTIRNNLEKKSKFRPKNPDKIQM